VWKFFTRRIEVVSPITILLPHHSGDAELKAMLVQIAASLSNFKETAMATLQDLVDATSAQSGEIASMKTFIAGLEQAIKDALSGVTLPPDAQAKVDGVFANVTANTQQIKDAIDNDPDTPPPVVDEPPV
jgi:hypothetical protein